MSTYQRVDPSLHPEADERSRHWSDRARHFAGKYTDHLRMVAFYRASSDPDAPEMAEKFVDAACRTSAQEAVALRSLNAVLMLVGGRAGDQFVVGREVYRIATAGCLAVHLGRAIPEDAPEITDADETREWRSEYADATRTA